MRDDFEVMSRTELKTLHEKLQATEAALLWTLKEGAIYSCGELYSHGCGCCSYEFPGPVPEEVAIAVLKMKRKEEENVSLAFCTDCKRFCEGEGATLIEYDHSTEEAVEVCSACRIPVDYYRSEKDEP